MDDEQEKDFGSIRSEGRSGSVLSCLSLLMSVVRILLEEGFMAPISLLKLLAATIDPLMAVWVIVIMVAGYWLKRTRLPDWAPPLPVLLLAMFLAIGFAFGWMQYGVDSWGGLAMVVFYGVGNAIFFTGISFIVYDIAHGTIKKAKAKRAEEARK